MKQCMKRIDMGSNGRKPGRPAGLMVVLAMMLVLMMALTGCGGEGAAAEPCEWPDSDIGKLLPETTAEATSVTFEEEYIYADLKMDKQEYKDYISACKDAGFTEEQSYSESDEYCYFDAKNKEKYSLSISYDSTEKIADLSLYEPEDKDEKAAEEQAEKKAEEDSDSDSSKESKKSAKSSDSSSSVSSDFKKTMDDYEAFMNDYVDFMKEYENSDDVASMLEDYGTMMDKYAKFEEKIDAIDEDELSSADYAYYVKVTGRVTEKLAELY